MGSIYNKAKEVIVWLGPCAENSGLALQFLKQIAASVRYDPDKRTLYSYKGEFAGLLEDNVEAARSHQKEILAIKDLLTRKWWSRLWIFQEIVSAQSAILVVGRDFIKWKVAVIGLRWILVSSNYLDRHIESLNFREISDKCVLEILNSGCNPTAYGVLDLLDRTSELACSDPRDRLYAIRSLIYNTQAKIIVPNYSFSVREVYLDFAKAWISQSGNANLFFCCDLVEQTDLPTNIDLPSWAPDWTRFRIEFDLSRPSGVSKSFPTFLEGDRLGIHGVLNSSLSYVTAPAKTLTTETQIRDHCKSWRQQMQMSGREMNGSSNHKPFLEIIVGGSIIENKSSVLRNVPTLEQVESFLDHPERIDEGWRNLLSVIIGRTVSKQALFQTTDGYLGIGPQSITPGDCVAIILGCRIPLILRPVSHFTEIFFCVVGPCYISGIMNAEALLGALPPGWSVREETLDGSEIQVFANESIKTQKDPRLPPLPPAWKYQYGSERQEVEAKELKDMRYQWFENAETGEETYFDPRLTPELLKERGVAIEELILV